MENTEAKKTNKTNILSITKDDYGNVCVEFNENEVVNLKQFIKKVFDDNENSKNESCIKQVRYPNPMPEMQPYPNPNPMPEMQPYPNPPMNCPPMGMMADKFVAPPSLQPMDMPPMMTPPIMTPPMDMTPPMMPPMDMMTPMMPPMTPAMDAQPMDAPKPIL